MSANSANSGNPSNPFEPAIPIDEASSQKKPQRFTFVEFLVVVAIIGVLVGLLMPAVRAARPAARRMQCSNNLKMIGLAMLNYESLYGQLPPAYTVDAEGNRLHSWRTLILPFMEQSSLYEKIDLSKPWNDPANLAVFGTRAPPGYQCPSNPKTVDHKTSYTVIVDPRSCFPGAEPIELRHITDGTSNTLLVVEAPEGSEVDWMSPYDIDLSVLTSIGSGGKTELAHQDVFQATFADGSVSAISKTATTANRVGLMTMAAGDSANRDE